MSRRVSAWRRPIRNLLVAGNLLMVAAPHLAMARGRGGGSERGSPSKQYDRSSSSSGVASSSSLGRRSGRDDDHDHDHDHDHDSLAGDIAAGCCAGMMRAAARSAVRSPRTEAADLEPLSAPPAHLPFAGPVQRTSTPGQFDPDLARRALESVEAGARERCGVPQHAEVLVRLVIDPSGRATIVHFEPRHTDAAYQRCLERELAAFAMPPFTGDAVTAERTLELVQ